MVVIGSACRSAVGVGEGEEVLLPWIAGVVEAEADGSRGRSRCCREVQIVECRVKKSRSRKCEERPVSTRVKGRRVRMNGGDNGECETVKECSECRKKRVYDSVGEWMTGGVGGVMLSVSTEGNCSVETESEWE
jgi:hypothetical protein